MILETALKYGVPVDMLWKPTGFRWSNSIRPERKNLYTLNTDGMVQSELPITGVDAPVWTGASVEATAVPEPASMISTLALVSSGLMLRRRTKHLR